MTFTPAHKPAGTPSGGQFTSTAHSDDIVSLSAVPQPGTPEFWARAAAAMEAREEKLRSAGCRNPPIPASATEEAAPAVPEAAPPARGGWFSRMFSALESFGTSVETRHRDEMDELESLARQNRIARAARRSGG